MKKLLTAALAVAALTMITGCTKKEASNGKVLNIIVGTKNFRDVLMTTMQLSFL